MRTLVIETATAACSVALIEAGVVVDSGHERVMRGHAERLLPMIVALRDGGRADRILVDVGPGSFTGIRVGVAAARALAFGWGVPVSGFHSLALLAAMEATPDERLVAIDGGHGEIFVGRYDGDPLRQLAAPRSIPFTQALTEPAMIIVGNAAHRLALGRRDVVAADREPDARGAIHLPPTLTKEDPTPFYGRNADAKPMAA